MNQQLPPREIIQIVWKRRDGIKIKLQQVVFESYAAAKVIVTAELMNVTNSHSVQVGLVYTLPCAAKLCHARELLKEFPFAENYKHKLT